MAHLSRLRLAILPTLVGSILVIIGVFLPISIEIFNITPSTSFTPSEFSRNTYWNMFHIIVTEHQFNWFWDLSMSSILLAILVPPIVSLAVFCGKGKPIQLYFSLLVTITGFFAYLLISTFIMVLSGFGGFGRGHTYSIGPGIKFMFSGFLLCIIGILLTLYILKRSSRTAVKTPVTTPENRQKDHPIQDFS